jgi:hypothetical protein
LFRSDLNDGTTITFANEVRVVTRFHGVPKPFSAFGDDPLPPAVPTAFCYVAFRTNEPSLPQGFQHGNLTQAYPGFTGDPDEPSFYGPIEGVTPEGYVKLLQWASTLTFPEISAICTRPVEAIIPALRARRAEA